MPSQRDHQKAIHVWLDLALIAALKEYQHQERLDSLTEAVDHLLRAGLAQAGVPVAESPPA